MASLGEIGGFDANKVEPNGNVIPQGDYDAVILDSKWEQTKKNNGKYLHLKLQIINGQYQNRIVFDRLNLQNPNAQAVQIAKATLSAICRAVNVLTPQDSAELHNRPLRITVVCKTDPEYGVSNEVKAYKSRHVGAPAPAAPPTYQAPQPVPVGAGATSTPTPW